LISVPIIILVLIPVVFRLATIIRLVILAILISIIAPTVITPIVITPVVILWTLLHLLLFRLAFWFNRFVGVSFVGINVSFDLRFDLDFLFLLLMRLWLNRLRLDGKILLPSQIKND